MANIFISYRRQDSAAQAMRLREDLVERYGTEKVFFDINNLEPGVSFTDQLHQAVESCSLILIVIGPQWVTADDSEGRRRLDNADDFIRTEVGAALRSQKPVVPVLVGNASMPSEAELPAELQGLSRLHAIALDDEFWREGLERLLPLIDSLISPTPIELPSDRTYRPPFRNRLVAAFNVLVGRANPEDRERIGARPSPSRPPIERHFETVTSAESEPPAASKTNSEVFMSYAEADRDIADSVVETLEAQDVSCWIAHRDIPPGTPSWSAPIVAAIASSRVFVVLVTSHSNASKQVLREVTVADDENVPLIPVRLDDSPLSDDFRYFFSSAQRLEAADLPLDQAIERLSTSVTRQLAHRN